MYPNCGRYLHTFGFGGKGIRTPDLLIANETLYQLSYTPPNRRKIIASLTIFIKHCPPEFGLRRSPEEKTLVSTVVSDTIRQLNDCDAGGPLMKNYNWISKLTVLLFAAVNLAIAAAVSAGGGYDYSRSELMGNSGLTIFREADFGNQIGLSISIDGIPVTTLSRGEGYRAMIRPGRHVLTVTNTPSPYGKTKFTHRTVDFVSGRNYSFTALWEVESILLEDGGYVYHGFYR